MKLIKNLGTIKDKNDNYQSIGSFLCIFCLQEVIKQLGQGKRDKSCGCKKGDLISKANKGKSVNKGLKKTEEHKQKIGQANKGKKRTEEQINSISESHKGQIPWNKGIPQTEETRQKISVSNMGKSRGKGKKFTEEHIQKLREASTGKTGELASNWQGGISDNPYPQEFNKQLKNFILKRDNYICQNPNCEHKTNILDCHHIDYDKQNNSLDNFITLCDSCHMKTNGKNKRQYFTEYYKNILLTNEKS